VFDVRDSGPPDGEAVMLLHGFPEDAASYDGIAAHLQASGLRTLAPDQRGYSPGARPRGRRAYRLGLLVGDVLALLDAAGVGQAHVVGHDWGAAVAWELARRHPARVRTLTALSVPHPAAMLWAMTRSRQALRSYYMAVVQLPWLPERSLAGRVGSLLANSGLNASDAARYDARFATPDSLTGPLNWYRALPLAGFDPEGRRAPRRVGVPTTYVWGRHDPFVDRVAAERCGHHVDGDYRFVELDADHWLPENHADAVAPLILSRVGLG